MGFFQRPSVNMEIAPRMGCCGARRELDGSSWAFFAASRTLNDISFDVPRV